jgi:hypothetical protein
MSPRLALVFLMLLALGPNAEAQQHTPGCTVRGEPARRIELPDGKIVSIDVQSLARRGDTVMVIGRYVYVFAASSTPASPPVMRDSIIGVLLVPGGKVSVVPAPLRSRRALFSKVAAGVDAFHAVFATSSDTAEVSLMQSSATIWYARFRNGAWTTPERVLDVNRVKLQHEATSAPLERNGVLSFAFTFADSADDLVDGGGVVMLRRRNGAWTADTLRTRRRPQAVRLAYGTSDGILKALTLLASANNTSQSQVQLATYAQDWRDTLVIAESTRGVLIPSFAALGDGYVASWTAWEPPSFESSTIEWVRVTREERVIKGRVISWGENTFPFEMFVMEAAHPMWLYRGAPPGHSIAVSSVTDSIPIALGSVAVPFENYKVTSIPIDRARTLAFTNTVGKSPDEPPGASYATVLEFRCPGSARR